MATQTATVSTGDWTYVDSFGIGHTVTDSETFTMEWTDGGEAAIQWYVNVAQSVALDDGGTVTFRTEFDNANSARQLGLFADANDTVLTYGDGGELVCECPVSGRIQRWKPAEITIDDLDDPADFTDMKFEDQFGNVMTLQDVAVA